MAKMTAILLLEKDEEPMATEPIYLSSGESEYSTPNTTLDHHQERIYPDFINQLITSELETTVKYGHTDRILPTNPKYVCDI